MESWPAEWLWLFFARGVREAVKADRRVAPPPDMAVWPDAAETLSHNGRTGTFAPPLHVKGKLEGSSPPDPPFRSETGGLGLMRLLEGCAAEGKD